VVKLLQVFMRSKQLCLASEVDMKKLWPYMCMYCVITGWLKSEYASLLFFLKLAFYHNLNN